MLSGITITSLLLTGCRTTNNNEVKENPNTGETQNNTAQTNTTKNKKIHHKLKRLTYAREVTHLKSTKSTEETTASETTAPEQTSEKINEKTLHMYLMMKVRKKQLI